MKRVNFKKRVTATLLATVLVVGCIPAISLVTNMNDVVAADSIERQVGDFVAAGKTAISKETTVDMTDNSSWTATKLDIFSEGTCPFTTEDTWVVEADIELSSNFNTLAKRIGLWLTGASGDGAVILSEGSAALLPASGSGASAVWKGTCDKIGDVTGTRHYKFTISKGKSITFEVTQAGTAILNQTYDLTAGGYDFTDQNYAPALVFANGDYKISNFSVNYIETLSGDLVAAGETVLDKEITVDMTDGTSWTATKLNIFGEETCPFTTEDTWVVEADIELSNNFNTQPKRIGLWLTGASVDGAVILSDGSAALLPASGSGASNVWKGTCDKIGDVTGARHYKFTISKGKSITFEVTQADTTVLNQTYDLTAGGYDFTDKDFAPTFVFANGDYKITNFSVSYILDDLESSNIVTAGGTAVNVETIVDMTDVTSWTTAKLNIFTEETCPFTTEDTWVVEADIELSNNFNSNIKRIGLWLTGASGDGAVILSDGSAALLPASGSGASNVWKGTCDKIGDVTGARHYKFTISKGKSIIFEVTQAGTTVLNQTYDLTAGGYDFTDKNFAPAFVFANGDYKLTNISVSCDLTSRYEQLKMEYDAALKKMQEIATPTFASENAMISALEKATPLYCATGDYTNAVAITDAIDDLTAAIAGYKEATATVTVGDGTLTEKVEIGIAANEALPTGEEVDGKYIFCWTYGDESVEQYTEGTDAEQYVANFFDKKMLTVKVQTKADENGKVTARFISSLDDYQREEYACLGFVLSTTTEDPLLATKPLPLTKEVYTVWEQLYADNELKNTDDVFNDGNEGGYSNYMFALDVDGLNDNSKVYARAFVKLTDGTIVYGEPCTKDIVVTQ